MTQESGIRPEWMDVDNPRWNRSVDRYRIKPEPTPDADGWIPHDGGQTPVDGGIHVDVKWSDGSKNYDMRADSLRWKHYINLTKLTHYRLAKPSEKKFVPWTRETCPPLGFEIVKKCNGDRSLITTAAEFRARVGATLYTWSEIFQDYTLRDGTPCGEEAK